MKSHEQELKLQAWLDGEMPSGEAAAFERSLAGDADFQMLMGELRRTKAALAGGEEPRALPESREFFWSKVKRHIELEAAPAARAPVAGGSLIGWVQARLLRLGGAAFVAGVILFFMLSPAKVVKEPGHVGKIEIACDSVGAYTYRDQQNQMTMVWLADKSADDSEFTDASPVDKVIAE
jgi:anti-sigma factor RsiW